ncbi:unnamed protein product [Chilo suppressalis]|uniref:Uncharacterized protein n=1 Tax=Chilo suppressalis TaxID=168631 RepID=A0ABN8B3M0_CHISP|nr:unnamed protein product [Chilo suppressalis]
MWSTVPSSSPHSQMELSSIRDLERKTGEVTSASTRYYSTEEKTVENDSSDKLPGTIEECHKQIEALTTEVASLKDQIKDVDDKYKRALADGENVRRRMMKQVEDAKSFAIQSFCKDLLDPKQGETVSYNSFRENCIFWSKMASSDSDLSEYENGEIVPDAIKEVAKSHKHADFSLWKHVSKPHRADREKNMACPNVADTLAAAAESVPETAVSDGGAALQSLRDGVTLTRAQLTQSINVPTAGALVGANDCKCSRDQQFNVPSEARRSVCETWFGSGVSSTREIRSQFARSTFPTGSGGSRTRHRSCSEQGWLQAARAMRATSTRGSRQGTLLLVPTILSLLVQEATENRTLDLTLQCYFCIRSLLRFCLNDINKEILPENIPLSTSLHSGFDPASSAIQVQVF